MLMQVHAYMSKNEVIGILAGQIYQTKLKYTGGTDLVKVIVISKIYPTESCIHNATERLRNCEISDGEQIRINSQIDKDGVVKLAWYHSHPFFKVDPSNLDLQTHCQQQIQFDQMGRPFFGVIVGPYSKNLEVDETQLNIFGFKNTNNLHKNCTRTQKQMQERARAYQFGVLPQNKIRKVIYANIRYLMERAAEHRFDKPDFDTEWSKNVRMKLSHTFK